MKYISVSIALLFIQQIAFATPSSLIDTSIEDTKTCLETEFEQAKNDYFYSSLKSVLNYESYVKLRCQPVMTKASLQLRFTKSLESIKPKNEVLDSKCPNCLFFSVRWDGDKVRSIGIRRNNVLLVGKEY